MPVVEDRRALKVIGKAHYQDLVLARNRALRAAERGETDRADRPGRTVRG